MYVCTYVRMYVSLCLYVCMFVCMYVCMYEPYIHSYDGEGGKNDRRLLTNDCQYGTGKRPNSGNSFPAKPTLAPHGVDDGNLARLLIAIYALA